MKVKKVKKYKPLIAAVGLSTMITLTGCGETNSSKTVDIGTNLWTSEITYEENTLSGTISYSNLEDGYVKIVTLSYNEKALSPKLLGIYFNEFRPTRGGWSDTMNYIDLESGVTILSYYWPTCFSEEKEPEIHTGENFTILEEKSLFDFIVEENWLQDEYDINELIEFYNEKVKITFENGEEANDLDNNPILNKVRVQK